MLCTLSDILLTMPRHQLLILLYGDRANEMANLPWEQLEHKLSKDLEPYIQSASSKLLAYFKEGTQIPTFVATFCARMVRFMLKEFRGIAKEEDYISMRDMMKEFEDIVEYRTARNSNLLEPRIYSKKFNDARYGDLWKYDLNGY